MEWRRQRTTTQTNPIPGSISSVFFLNSFAQNKSMAECPKRVSCADNGTERLRGKRKIRLAEDVLYSRGNLYSMPASPFSPVSLVYRFAGLPPRAQAAVAGERRKWRAVVALEKQRIIPHVRSNKWPLRWTTACSEQTGQTAVISLHTCSTGIDDRAVRA